MIISEYFPRRSGISVNFAVPPLGRENRSVSRIQWKITDVNRDIAVFTVISQFFQ
jgi:hypothetical protein